MKPLLYVRTQKAEGPLGKIDISRCRVTSSEPVGFLFLTEAAYLTGIELNNYSGIMPEMY